MITAEDLQRFSENDRIGLTLFLSLLLHLVLVLGTSFTLWQQHQHTSLPALDIILVNSSSQQKPKKADFFAQANQDGGGNRDRNSRPRSPSLPARGQSIVTQYRKLPAASLETTRSSNVLTRKLPAKFQLHSTDDNTKRPRKTPSQAVTSTSSEQQEATYFEAEFNQLWEAYQKRPRNKYISARTREYRYAAYMEAWRLKVEQIGNLNYPEEARRRRLSGKLVLDVGINPDGTIHTISMLRSSGHQVLDDAAIRIVKLATPYAVFPPNIRSQVDILHIIRTWKFMRDNRLTSR